jgi:predicted ATP-dependent serine protease
MIDKKCKARYHGRCPKCNRWKECFGEAELFSKALRKGDAKL